MKEEFTLSKSHSLILSAISYLKDKGLATSASGLYEVLTGTHKDERVKDLECYGYYSQLGSRTFHSRVRILERYGFITYRYEESISDYVLILSEKGKKEVKPIKWHSKRDIKSNIIEIKE